MKYLALILTIISMVLLMGMSECGPCPPSYYFNVVSGNYSHVDTIEVRKTPPDTPFPHANTTDMKMTVDVDSSTVVIKYRKDGKSIVETWQISDKGWTF